jgi:hypothetical protein
MLDADAQADILGRLDPRHALAAPKNDVLRTPLGRSPRVFRPSLQASREHRVKPLTCAEPHDGLYPNRTCTHRGRRDHQSCDLCDLGPVAVDAVVDRADSVRQ